MSDERWVEIETKLAFQERAIGRLEEAMREQQKQIDRLKTLVERLKAKSAADPAEDPRDEPPPPHWGGRAGE
jgi:SlyX protein